MFEVWLISCWAKSIVTVEGLLVRKAVAVRIASDFDKIAYETISMLTINIYDLSLCLFLWGMIYKRGKREEGAFLVCFTNKNRYNIVTLFWKLAEIFL